MPINPYLVCAVHLDGVDGDSCLDFREDPNIELYELWQPEGATSYNGELILQPRQHWTREQQLELIDWHPMFTGRPNPLNMAILSKRYFKMPKIKTAIALSCNIYNPTLTLSLPLPHAD